MNKIGSENIGARGRGRPKGSVNKVTAAAKDAIAQAAEMLGGVDRLHAWAASDDKNESAFWTTIYPKLLPLQVNGAGDNGEHLARIEHVIIDAKG
jgi:hypothetical protein